ncbi:transposase (IS4), partial [mine drainage metagenome]
YYYMTYIRKQVQGSNVYRYSVRSYRDPETGKVRQEVTYLGKEVDVNGEKALKPPVDRKSVRRVLDSGPYVMYRVAEDHGFIRQYDEVMANLTGIKHAARKVIILAAESILGPGHSAYVHTSIPDLTDKETRDIVDLVGRKDPDTIGMLEKSMATLIVKEFGSSGLVYDLSAVRYYGTENDLAKYGHYYHSNGENREINFVLAVTGNGGIPVHHRPLAGSIPSVSTIRGFTGELKDLGIMGILVVMDRGFYSSDNLKDLKNYSVIGALPSTVGIHDDLILESRDIENSTNYFQYHEETVFMGEKRIHGIRYIVFFSPRLRTRKLESLYHRISEKEDILNDLMGRKFDSPNDMARTVEAELKGFRNLIDVTYDRESTRFSYVLKNNAIQRRTNRFGYTILLTNTMIAAPEILRIYRDKDKVEKASAHLKPHLEPFFSRSEEGTRARLFLAILGYTMVAIIASVCGITYAQ